MDQDTGAQRGEGTCPGCKLEHAKTKTYTRTGRILGSCAMRTVPTPFLSLRVPATCFTRIAPHPRTSPMMLVVFSASFFRLGQ